MADGSNSDGVYTVLVLVAVVAMAIGVGMLWYTNGTMTEGDGGGLANPFHIVSDN